MLGLINFQLNSLKFMEFFKKFFFQLDNIEVIR